MIISTPPHSPQPHALQPHFGQTRKRQEPPFAKQPLPHDEISFSGSSRRRKKVAANIIGYPSALVLGLGVISSLGGVAGASDSGKAFQDTSQHQISVAQAEHAATVFTQNIPDALPTSLDPSDEQQLQQIEADLSTLAREYGISIDSLYASMYAGDNPEGELLFRQQDLNLTRQFIEENPALVLEIAEKASQVESLDELEQFSEAWLNQLVARIATQNPEADIDLEALQEKATLAFEAAQAKVDQLEAVRASNRAANDSMNLASSLLIWGIVAAALGGGGIAIASRLDEAEERQRKDEAYRLKLDQDEDSRRERY